MNSLIVGDIHNYTEKAEAFIEKYQNKNPRHQKE